MTYLKSILVLSSLFVLAGSAQAADYKNYNGSVCKTYYSSQASRVNHYYSGIYNKSTSGTYINCPIVTDHTSPTTGTLTNYVYYNGASSNGRASCYLKSVNSNGSTRQTKSGSRIGSGWIRIPGITSESSTGNLSLYCYLPKKGRISSILIREKN